MIGVVKTWDLERGFGWFSSPNGRKYFCHITNWLEQDAPKIGSAVQFELGAGLPGKRLQAVDARFAVDAIMGLEAIVRVVSK